VARRRTVGIAFALGAVGVSITMAALAHGGRGTQQPEADSTREATTGPNILVVTTDDQPASQFLRHVMPFTFRFFHRHGSVFVDSLAVPPLCCPDRAGFLTGEYAQNHGVLTNESGYADLREKQNTLPVWLRRAGYRTALVGKYLNEYPALGPTPAPGWDRFFAAGGETIGYRDFDVGVDGQPRHYDASHYSTDVYTHAAMRFIGNATGAQQPFFLWLTYNAPHTIPEGQAPCSGESAQPKSMADYRQAAGVPLPERPRDQERDVSDKGPWVAGLPPLSPHRFAWIHRKWQCALATLRSVDRGLRSIIGQLRREGELRRTLMVFTSDNGFFYGEHRIPADKRLPYDPSLRVPLAIFVPPGLAAGQRDSPVTSLVSNVDLAPTLLDYAEGQPCKNAGRCRTLDGHSLRPLLEGRAPAWTRHRALPIELNEDFNYQAMRTPGILFMRLLADRTGRLAHPEYELYDLRRDPRELHNMWTRSERVSKSRRQRLIRRLGRLTHCAGTHGRDPCP
jgi:N-acetylglucosamine-6-sulfatase